MHKVMPASGGEAAQHRGSPDQRGHQQGVEGGQLDKADHHAETLLQAEMSPVADWYFTCNQLSALLLFCCHCV